MKVLEKGRQQKGWANEYHCSGKGNGLGGCKAKLLVEEGDLFYTYRSTMGRDEEWFVTFQCPECTRLTDVDDTPFLGRNLPSYKEWLDRER